MASSGYMDYLGMDRKLQDDMAYGKPGSEDSVMAPKDSVATDGAPKPGDGTGAGGKWAAASEAVSKSGGKGTGSTVLQGALSGAAAGSMIAPGWGTAIGAGAGSLAALMSAQAEMEAEKRKALEEIYAKQGAQEQSALQNMNAGWARIL